MQSLENKQETCFVDTLSNIMKLINDDSAFQKKDNIKQFEDKLESIQDKQQLNSLESLLEILIRTQSNIEKKNYLLNINFKLQTKILEQNQNLDEFTQELIEKNQQWIGISFLNNDGSFVLSDQKTRELLEITKTVNDQKYLLQYCSQAGYKTLCKQFKHWPTLLEEDELSKEFQMTIYSERMRRKALKHLSAQRIEKLKECQYQNNDYDQNQSQKKNKKRIKQEIKINQHDAIKIKYLKTVQIKLTKMTINVTQEFQQSVQESKVFQGSSNLSYMAENSQQYFKVVKCEIQACHEIEDITSEEIFKDQRLLEYERKWQDKCKKIKDEIRQMQYGLENSNQDQFQPFYSDHEFELSNNIKI
ncbi:unnamed protein product [Paramecium sonneborni]|uniref:Uncharacterized protein n=1 Tax=Paramecium sonneborni TaxID=65129 RepID=A0A8S1KX56_9CILI|nr:unnamed protein product [Paramecium sonneborni]